MAEFKLSEPPTIAADVTSDGYSAPCRQGATLGWRDWYVSLQLLFWTGLLVMWLELR